MLFLIAFLICAGVTVAAVATIRALPTRWDSIVVVPASAAGPLRMEFPEPMDHASVEQFLTLPAGAKGALTWDGNALLFVPETPLERDVTYAFFLGREAKTAKGDPIDTSLEFHFRITGNPVITAKIPSPNAADVATDKRITVVFDRPIIALAQVGTSAAPSGWERVTIEPRTAGRWRWLSTYAAEFIPESGLLPSELYTVTVPAGLMTINKEKTERDERWSFETVRPSVNSLEPEDQADTAGPTTALTVHFDHEVDLTSAAKHIELLLLNAKTATSSTGTGSTRLNVQKKLDVRNVSYGKTRTEDGSWIQDRSVIVATPASPLAFASSFALRVTPGVQALGGGELGSKTESVSQFTTVGPFAAVGIEYQNGGVTLRFNNPVSSGSLLRAVTFDPKPENWEEMTFEPNAWEADKSVTIYPALEPGRKYTVTISTDALDRFDQKLSAAFNGNFTTPDLDPQVTLGNSRGDFGVFERNKPPVYLLRSVNTGSIDIDLAKLTLEQFLTLRKKQNEQWDFSPDLTGFGAHKHWRLTTKNVKNAWETLSVDVQDLLASSLDGGMYVLTVKAPGFVTPWDKKPAQLTQYFSLTNTALTLKFSGKKALVWAVDMQTGKPVGGAQVSFRALDGSTPVTGKTDDRGFLDTEIPIDKLSAGSNSWQPEFWVTATKGSDFSFVSSRWTDPVVTGDFAMWWDFQSADAAKLRAINWVQTDRNVYRPGDTVSLKGFVRHRDWDGKLLLPDGKKTATVVIQNPDGVEVLRRELPFTEFGTFSFTFPTTKESALGAYSVLVTSGEETYQQLGATFQILAYRKPEYKVDLIPRDKEIMAGDTLTIDLAGSYYFGAPLAEAPVTWRAQTQDYYFNKVTDDWYAFSSEDSWCWWDCPTNQEIFAEGKGKLDEAGKLTITIPARIAEKKLSQILTIEADVVDANSQTVSNRTSVIVHQSQAYVGVRTEDYVVTPGSSAKVKVITVDPDGKPIPRKLVTLTLSSRTWNTIRRKNVDGGYYYENEPQDTVVRTLTATTDADGKAVSSIPVEKGGQYVVKASVADNGGRTSESSTSLYAWSSTFVNWPHGNTDRVDVLVDKPEYKVGDTAKLLVKSPYQGEGVSALVTVERENVITRKVIPVKSNAESIEVPITEDLLPNAYVSVVIIKPRIGETFDENGLDTGAPAFKIGYAQLKIETSRKQLSVEVLPDKERYLPGEKVSATLRVRDADGKPVRAELSFAAVDASVLALTGYVRPDLVTAFYTQHGLGVYTAPTLQYLVERFKPGSKGGGGGLEERARENFQDTATWQPHVLTDDKGEAAVTFVLPDNLTTWQLLAVAATKDSKFGAVDKEILATKKVILRPVQPRFAVLGDTMTLKAIVHNFLPEKNDFTVSLLGSGFTLQSGARPSRTISLDADEQATVTFPIAVDDGSVHGLAIRMRAETSGAKDEVAGTIPTFAPGTPESTATWGRTDTMAKETVTVPSAADAAAGSLLVTMSPSIAAYLPSGLEHVVDFPYGCAEQTASAFLPSVALKKLQGFDVFAILPKQTLDAKVTKGLQTLYSFQRADGGFGYWEGSSQSYAPLSAYVLYALSTAQDGGYAVDTGVIRRAEEYLRAALRSDVSTMDDATRAYVLYVLSETGKGDANLALNLFERRKNLPIYAKAQLAMALQAGRSSGTTRAAETLGDEIASLIIKDGRGAHVEEKWNWSYAPLMQTNERATAVVLRSLLRIHPDSAFVPDLVRWLLTSRRDGHWDTTQSTTETLLAFMEYLRNTGELDASFTAGTEVNGAMKKTQKFDKSTVLTKADLLLTMRELKEGDNSLSIGKDGTGTLYYDMLFTVVPAHLSEKAQEEGISILREVRPLAGTTEGEPVLSAKLGNTYAITLTMTVPQQRFSVAVESPLPAGFEAIDTHLQTTAQVGGAAAVDRLQQRRSWWESDSSLWYFNHAELRDDRVFLFADTLPAGTYRYTYFVRATTPGTFQTRPARIWEMYRPENFGATAGSIFTVNE